MKISEVFSVFIWVLASAVPGVLILGRGAADTAMALVSVAFLITSFRHRSFNWVRQPWFVTALIITVYLVISGLLSDIDLRTAAKDAIVWLRFPLFTAAFAYWILPQTNVQKWLMPYLAVLLSFVAIDTIVQFVWGTSLSGHPKPEYDGRLTGPFDRMVVGVYLERLVWPIIGLLFGWSLSAQHFSKKIILPMLFCLLVSSAILLSGERMAFALFGLCAVLFFAGAKNIRKQLFIIGMMVAVTAVTLVFLNPTLKARFITRSTPYLSDLSNSPYGSVWHNGLAAWKHAPILGVGRNNFVTACESLGREGGFINENEDQGQKLICVRHPHNIYIEWLAEGGVIGLVLFLVMLGFILHHAVSALRNKDQTLSDYYTRLGYAVGLVPFLWPFMSSMSFFTNWSAILFWWVLGLVMQPVARTENKAT